jgi:hypothetical protein
LVGRYPGVEESEGHLWVPIAVTLEAAGHDPVGRILEVAGDVHRQVWDAELVAEAMPSATDVVVPA